MRENDAVKRTSLVVCLLMCAAASAAFASRLWSVVLDFEPAFVFSHEPAATGAPLTHGVTILLIDGLRLDASRQMKSLNELRAQGADVEAQVGTPSFSRPGRATIAVGAPPSVHGVTTNRQKRALVIDNLIRRVGAAGGTCRIAGSKIWPGLFGADIARCGVYQADEAKEGPGAFVRQVPAVRSSQEAGIEFVMKDSATLRIADIISADFAAHEYGGSSPEYLAEVARADETLAALVHRLDLSRETLIVTADHGHRDAGGHGGDEPKVLAIPIVIVGAGIRPGVRLEALQADIAPTVAALLGVAVPSGSAGSPMASILVGDEAKLIAVRAAGEAQATAFKKVVAGHLGLSQAAADATPDWLAVVRSFRDAEASRRLPALAIVTVLILVCLGIALRVASPDPWSVLAGVAAALLALAGPIGPWIPAMSFSAINYDEMLVPFFIRILTLASATALVATSAAMVVGHVVRKRPATDTPAVRAGATGLVGSAVLVLAITLWWWRYLLLDPFTLPGPNQLVEAFALTLSVASVSGTSLAVMALLWMRRPGPPVD